MGDAAAAADGVMMVITITVAMMLQWMAVVGVGVMLECPSFGECHTPLDLLVCL